MTSLMKIYSKSTRKGSDPRLQTCRGKLQNTRSKLNMEINKELMLRAGAENLLHASTNKVMRRQVAMELEFFNSNLNLLKERLAELNSSVEIYQPSGSRCNIPLIPLGLKETKEIDFRTPFKSFIGSHYYEDADTYDEAITEFMELREAMRTPERDESGVSLLFEYFNMLYFVDKRFFPHDKPVGIFFEWYDSLTGAPSSQRSAAFEKACVLFNLAALYTQLGARHDRTSPQGLDAAVNCLLRCCGVLDYLLDTFTNAPSKDLSPELLQAIIALMLAQARECLHDKATLNSDDSSECLLELAQEAAFLGQEYDQVHGRLAPLRSHLPAPWLTLVLIKAHFYRGKAHQHVSEAMLWHPPGADPPSPPLSPRSRELLRHIHRPPDPSDPTAVDFCLPDTPQQRNYLGLCHGREASCQYEESLRQQRMCRELRGRALLTEVLRDHEQQLREMVEPFEGSCDDVLLDPPAIVASTKLQLSVTRPDFAAHASVDPFHALGPVSHFSSRKLWRKPREVTLTRTRLQGFGFSVRGDAPVSIDSVDPGSLAKKAGVVQGDLVVGIGPRDVRWLPHERVVAAIRDQGDCLTMTLVTPCGQPCLGLSKSRSLRDLSHGGTLNSTLNSTVSSSSSSGVGSSASGVGSSLADSTHGSSQCGSLSSTLTTPHHSSKRNSWNPFKKTLSRDRLKATSVADFSLIAR